MKINLWKIFSTYMFGGWSLDWDSQIIENLLKRE
jgi:hypothetical protein